MAFDLFRAANYSACLGAMPCGIIESEKKMKTDRLKLIKERIIGWLNIEKIINIRRITSDDPIRLLDDAYTLLSVLTSGILPPSEW